MTAYLLLKTFWPVYGKKSVLTAFLLIALSNCIGLVFLGMETSVQVLITVAVVSAMINLTENKPLPQWLGIALILGLLFRYELLSVSLGAVGLLVLHKYYRYIGYAAISIMILGFFSLYLWQHQGVILPVSVMSKLIEFPSNPPGIFSLSLETILLGVLAFSFRKSANRLLLFFYIMAVVLAHLLFGKCSWFSRYEIYAFIAAAMILIYYTPLSSFNNLLEKPAGKTLVVISIFFCTAYYALITLSIPNGTSIIYTQHGQMKRLIKEAGFPASAVNDIGYVSFRNPSYVFDLYGLGNPDIFKMRRENKPEWLSVVSTKSVQLAMIYVPWFGESAVPKNWIELGSLHTLEPLHGIAINILGEPAVSMYATNPEAAERLKPVISNWIKELPENDVWVWEN